MAQGHDLLRNPTSEDPDPMVEHDSSPSTIFFNGKIPDAIAAIKSEQKILIVYIAGDNEDSSKLDETLWTDSKVCDVVSKQFVALRLHHGSSDATHFAAMFPYQQIPAISIVNHNGMLLKRHGGFINSDDFLQILEESLALQIPPTMKDNPQSESSCSSQKTSMEDPERSEQVCRSLNLPSSENNIVASVSQLTSNSTQSNVPQGIPSSTSKVLSSPKQPTSNLMVPEETEISAHCGKPQELPSSSKTVTQNPSMSGNSKSLIQNHPVSPAISKGNSLQVAKKDNGKKFMISENMASYDNERSEEKKEAADSLLLQVKLTNGKSIRGNFKFGDRLAAVKKFVDENRTDGHASYSLAVIYPRKVFTQEDMEKTLKELNFEDRATLVLVASSSQRSLEASSSSREQTDSGMKNTSDNPGIWKFLSYLNPFSYFKGTNDADSDGSGSSNWQYDPDSALIQRLRASSEAEGFKAQKNKDDNGRKDPPGKSWGGNIPHA